MSTPTKAPCRAKDKTKCPYHSQGMPSEQLTLLREGALINGDIERYQEFVTAAEEAEKDRFLALVAVKETIKNGTPEELKEALNDRVQNLFNRYDEQRFVTNLMSQVETADELKRYAESESGNMAKNIQKGYENLSDEEKQKFLDEAPAKALIPLLPIGHNWRQISGNSKYHKPFEAIMYRADVTDESVIRKLDSITRDNELGNRILNDINTGKRTAWPFTAALGDVEKRTFGGFRAGSMQRKDWVEHTTNKEVLARIGANDSISLPAIINNPALDGKVAATILSKNNNLTSVQYDKLLSKVAGDDRTRPQLKKAVQDNIGYSLAAKLTPEESKEALDTIRKTSRYIRNTSIQARRSDIGSLIRKAREDQVKVQRVKADSARAKLDSTDVAYDSLVKQKAYLEKNATYYRTNKSYKNVLKRLENANRYREVHGAIKSIREVISWQDIYDSKPFRGDQFRY
jgi:hypothetical protein